MSLPHAFQDVAHLEEVMSTPSEALSKELNELEGDILILGVGGKMGPTLARMAKLAAPKSTGAAAFPTKAGKAFCRAGSEASMSYPQ